MSAADQQWGGVSVGGRGATAWSVPWVCAYLWGHGDPWVGSCTLTQGGPIPPSPQMGADPESTRRLQGMTPLPPSPSSISHRHDSCWHTVEATLLAWFQLQLCSLHTDLTLCHPRAGQINAWEEQLSTAAASLPPCGLGGRLVESCKAAWDAGGQ